MSKRIIKVKNTIKQILSFQLVNSPKDYDFYLRGTEPFKKDEKTILETIYDDVSKINNDFKTVFLREFKG